MAAFVIEGRTVEVFPGAVPGSPVVYLNTCEQEGEAVCRVEDDGIGIAPEHLDKIWNRFYRVDEAHGSGEGNSGLGLALVKWIAEAHGGRVSVQSEPGKGSRFTVRLPLGGEN